MRIAFTANGPGEFAGWLRPLLFALYQQDPDLEAQVFCVPDDYATGTEAAYVRTHFPDAAVYTANEYVRFAFGRSVARAVDRVQYLGGDLFHAARVQRRAGGRLTTYRFARRGGRGLDGVFAVDEANRTRLLASGVDDEKIAVVGNLAIDGALGEADGAYGDPPDERAQDGILIFPGSRRHEVANLYGFFLAVALHVRRRLPGVPIAFARSPFVSDDDVRAAVRSGGDPRVYGARGELVAAGDVRAIVADGHEFALVSAPMRAAAPARLAISIPGTKLVELAALGIPAVVTTLFNAPELAVINGPLQYTSRIPLAGKALKRAAVVAFTKRFTYFAQPNIDADEAILPELRGTLFPGRVASVAVERYLDRTWCTAVSGRLAGQYAHHRGAATRMAAELLSARSFVNGEPALALSKRKR